MNVEVLGIFFSAFYLVKFFVPFCRNFFKPPDFLKCVMCNHPGTVKTLNDDFHSVCLAHQVRPLEKEAFAKTDLACRAEAGAEEAPSC